MSGRGIRLSIDRLLAALAITIARLAAVLASEPREYFEIERGRRAAPVSCLPVCLAIVGGALFARRVVGGVRCHN